MPFYLSFFDTFYKKTFFSSKCSNGSKMNLRSSYCYYVNVLQSERWRISSVRCNKPKQYRDTSVTSTACDFNCCTVIVVGAISVGLLLCLFWALAERPIGCTWYWYDILVVSWSKQQAKRIGLSLLTQCAMCAFFFNLARFEIWASNSRPCIMHHACCYLWLGE